MESKDWRSNIPYIDLGESEDEEFGSVLRSLRFDVLPSFVTAVRSSGHRSTGFDTPHSPSIPVKCEILRKVSYGSYHAVLSLSFADERVWALKIPRKGHGTRWSRPLAQALESEAQTMRLIRRETTIPVPEVFAFDAKIDNELGCPFILMELVPGRSVYRRWFNEDVSLAKRK